MVTSFVGKRAGFFLASMLIAAALVALVHQRASAQDSATSDDGSCMLDSESSPEGASGCVGPSLDGDFVVDGTAPSSPSTSRMQAAPGGPYKVKVIWARPAGVALPKSLDKNLTIQITNIQDYLRKEVNRTLRIEPGIPKVTVPRTSSAGDVTKALRNQGYTDRNTYYIVLADLRSGSNVCGLGGGQYAVVWVPSCGLYPNDVTDRLTDTGNVMLHELFHGLGAVPSCAPNSDGAGHMKDGQKDLMSASVYSGQPRIDAGRDDYFETGRSDCTDIAKVDIWIPKAKCASGPWCPPKNPPPRPPQPPGPARQSSTQVGGIASRAFDGNTDGTFGKGSVTHTRSQQNPWWEVTLPERQALGQVVVWNRTDCCADRLSDFWVLVSDKPFATNDLEKLLADPAVTAKRVRKKPTPKVAVGFPGVNAKYVRVQLQGRGILSLAEVKVIPGNRPPSNPTARQSSTFAGGVAARAIDGKTDGNFRNRSVSHTTAQSNPWWQMDMAKSSTINQVVVWNRTDCCGDRLSDFWVLVSDQPFKTNDLAKLINDPAVTARRVAQQPNPKVTVGFGGVRGRYVRVQLTGRGILSLAEVQVR